MFNLKDKLQFFYRILGTVRFLKPRQIFYQIWYRIRKRGIPYAPQLQTCVLEKPKSWIIKRHSWVPGQSFTFLNETRTHDEWVRWEDPGAEKLWLYNLHYFDYLLAGQSEPYLQRCDVIISDWVLGNVGPLGNAWEPYPTSLRVVNWIKYQTLHHRLDDPALESLARQVCWLANGLEYHLLANHLFANAKALVFAGLFFKGDEARKWLQQGLSLISSELDEQILPDGGHYERTPMYHSILLEDVLDLINMAGMAGKLVPKSTQALWRDTADQMLRWHLNTLHPDGQFAFFNDAAFEVAPESIQLTEYASKLGISVSEAHGNIKDCAGEKQSRLLEASGYARLCRGQFSVIAGLAPIAPSYQPGHAHADTLSCEVSVGDERIFVNTGTSTYKKGPLRDWQRSTAAHNTVELGGQNSSDVWGGFRVSRRARVTGVSLKHEAEYVELCGDHDGYRKLKGSPVHRRHWRLSDAELIITDTVSATDVKIVSRWLLHPSVRMLENNRLRTKNGMVVTWQLSGGTWVIEDAYWYPEFGLKQPTQRIVIEAPAFQEKPMDTSLIFTLTCTSH